MAACLYEGICCLSQKEFAMMKRRGVQQEVEGPQVVVLVEDVEHWQPPSGEGEGA